jgi:hypothetical protein
MVELGRAENMNNTTESRGLFRGAVSPMITIGLLVLLFMPQAIGGPVAGLNAFTNGTVADAVEVNANFTNIAAAVNDNDSRIMALEGATPPAPEQVIRSNGLQPGANGTVYGIYGQSGSAGNAQSVVLKAGTLEGLSARVTATLPAGSNMVVTLVKNGVDTAASVSISPANGTSLQTDAATTVNVVVGDLITFKMAETGGVAPGTGTHAAVILK